MMAAKTSPTRPELSARELQNIVYMISCGESYGCIGKLLLRSPATIKKLAMQAEEQIRETQEYVISMLEELIEQSVIAVNYETLSRMSDMQRGMLTRIVTGLSLYNQSLSTKESALLVSLLADIIRLLIDRPDKNAPAPANQGKEMDNH